MLPRWIWGILSDPGASGWILCLGSARSDTIQEQPEWKDEKVVGWVNCSSLIPLWRRNQCYLVLLTRALSPRSSWAFWSGFNSSGTRSVMVLMKSSTNPYSWRFPLCTMCHMAADTRRRGGMKRRRDGSRRGGSGKHFTELENHDLFFLCFYTEIS